MDKLAITWTVQMVDNNLYADELEQLFEESENDTESEYSEDAEILESIATVASNNSNYYLGGLSSLEKAMSKYPIITDVEVQFEYIEQYRDGKKARLQLEEYGHQLDIAEQQTLAIAVSRGENAAAALLGCMFKLVVQIAKEQAIRRYGKSRGTLLVEDLVAEANIALTKALDTYDRKKCPTWSLYAGKTIRNTIRNKLASTSETAHVAVPASWWRLQRIAVPIAAELAEEYGREPTTEEMQAALRVRGMEWAYDHLTAADKKLSKAQQRKICEKKLIKHGMDRAIKSYDQIRQLAAPTASLNATLSDDGERTRGDTIASDHGMEDSTFFSDELERDEARKDLMEALSTFDDREKQIILYRFGFVDDGDWHYTKLAPKFGVSPERVRQIEQKVLRKLKGLNFSHLKAHVDGDMEEN